MIELEVTRIATAAIQVTLPSAIDSRYMKLDSYRIGRWRLLARKVMNWFRPKPLSVSTEWFPHLTIKNITEQDVGVLVIHAYPGETIEGCSSLTLRHGEQIMLKPQQLGEEKWGWIAHLLTRALEN